MSVQLILYFCRVWGCPQGALGERQGLLTKGVGGGEAACCHWLLGRTQGRHRAKKPCAMILYHQLKMFAERKCICMHKDM